MNIYIDCEFNGWNGELISMALVSEDQEFYEVLELPENVDPWVAENVVPILNKEFITKTEFSAKLLKFLKQYDDIKIIADWPDDISYFCKALITGPGRSLGLRRSVEFLLDYQLSSTNAELPHNALSDARAIKQTAESPPRNLY